jgi:hypothetical protein
MIGMELTDVRGNKQTYRLSVDIPADYAPPASGDRITFNTTHPAIPSMEIPILSRGNETAVKRTSINQRLPVKKAASPEEAKKPEAMKPVG